jgi:zinc/manganese transport system substrate-binding protein
MKTNTVIVAAVIVVLVLVAALFAGLYLSTSSTTSTANTTSTGSSIASSGKVIRVVAGENFWGSLISQLGGVHVSVLSIVSDPNADPHQYESNTADAEAIANASFVIVNGAGYDTWALQLISASNTPNQKVLNVQQLLNSTVNPGCAEANSTAVKGCANPHFWYSPYYVNYTVHAMYNDLVSIDPNDTAYFHQQYASLNASLYSSYMSREAEIKAKYAGATVAATEDIFIYMANATGLKVISPPEFMQAVAEGNDPPASSEATFQQLIQGGNSTIHVLIYNEQTVTPVTQNIKSLAAQHEIPTIGVTETIQPPDVAFQVWQGSELVDLQNALNAQALGQ